MPTENPKISTYVPQVVYDRFREYQQERGLSMSQAAIEIFANYLGINLEAPLQEFTSGLPSRLIQVEQSLAQLKELYFNLASKVENFQTTSEPLKNSTPDDLIDNVLILSEPLSEVEGSSLKSDKEPDLRGELLSNSRSSLLEKEQPRPHIQDDTLDSEPLSEPLISIPLKNDEVESKVEVSSNPITELKNLEGGVQLNLIDSPSGSLSSLLKELSLSAVKLGERLSIDRTTIGSRAKKKSVDEFTAMTALSDPDSIPWVYSEQLKRYVPYGELSVEQIESLKAWKERQSTK